MTSSNNKPGWGIIRVAPRSGLFPEDDLAYFDGWYSHRADAMEIGCDWAKRYQGWTVALVRDDQVWWPNSEEANDDLR